MALRWSRFWYWWFSSAFLKAYLKRAEGAVFLPKDRADRDALLGVYLLEANLRNLSHELVHRPEWIAVSAQAIADHVHRR
jgi:maltose alpha-D-glucosyltransferase/alpha-amylase